MVIRIKGLIFIVKGKEPRPSKTNDMMRRFDRHEHMDSDTRQAILRIQGDVFMSDNANAGQVVNMLAGAFDGYNYSDDVREAIRGWDQRDTLTMAVVLITKVIDGYPMCPAS